MATQLLIESQGAPDPARGSRCLRMARHLATAGTETVVFLLDDGVGAAVGSHPELSDAVEAGACVWADEESLAERAISVDQLVPGVLAVGLTKVAPMLFDPAVKVVWH